MTTLALGIAKHHPGTRIIVRGKPLGLNGDFARGDGNTGGVMLSTRGVGSTRSDLCSLVNSVRRNCNF